MPFHFYFPLIFTFLVDSRSARPVTFIKVYPMHATKCALEGVLILEPKVFGDHRGSFMELWNEEKYRASGIHLPFVQDNVSFSPRNVLRGLHWQSPQPQGKLASVLLGEVFDVVVDLRQSSPTFGKSFGLELSSVNRRQLYVPPEFAHGFVVTSETAIFNYKCTAQYSPKNERILRWDDPDVAISWPVKSPILSEKDAQGLKFRDIPGDFLFP